MRNMGALIVIAGLLVKKLALFMVPLLTPYFKMEFLAVSLSEVKEQGMDIIQDLLKKMGNLK